MSSPMSSPSSSFSSSSHATVIDLGDGYAYQYPAASSPCLIKVAVMDEQGLWTHIHPLLRQHLPLQNLLIRSKTGQIVIQHVDIELIPIIPFSPLHPSSPAALQLLRSPLSLHLLPYVHLYVLSVSSYTDYIKVCRPMITAFLKQIHNEDNTSLLDKDKHTLHSHTQHLHAVSEMLLLLCVHAEDKKEAKVEKKIAERMKSEWGKDSVVTVQLADEAFNNMPAVTALTNNHHSHSRSQTTLSNSASLSSLSFFSSSSSSLLSAASSSAAPSPSHANPSSSPSSVSSSATVSPVSSIMFFLLPALKQKLLSVFHTRCDVYDFDLRKSLSTSTIIGWNYSRFLCVKESYALMMTSMNVYADSLRMYDELIAMMDEKTVMMSMSSTLPSIQQLSFNASSFTLSSASLAPLFDLQSKDYHYLIYTSHLPLLDFHRYIFARVSMLLFKQNQYDEVIERGVALLTTMMTETIAACKQLQHSGVTSSTHATDLQLVMERWNWLIGAALDLFQRCQGEIRQQQIQQQRLAEAEQDSKESPYESKTMDSSSGKSIRPTLKREESGRSFFRSSSPERKKSSSSLSTTIVSSSAEAATVKGDTEKKEMDNKVKDTKDKDKDKRSKSRKIKAQLLLEQQQEQQLHLQTIAANKLSFFFTLINHLQTFLNTYRQLSHTASNAEANGQVARIYDHDDDEGWNYADRERQRTHAELQRQQRLSLLLQWHDHTRQTHPLQQQQEQDQPQHAEPFVLSLHEPVPTLVDYVARYQQLQYTLKHPCLSPLLLHSLLYVVAPSLSLSSLHAHHFSTLYAHLFTTVCLPSLSSPIYHYLSSLYLHHRWYVLAHHNIVMRMKEELDRGRWDTVAECILLMLGITQQRWIKVKVREIKRYIPSYTSGQHLTTYTTTHYSYPCCSAAVSSSTAEAHHAAPPPVSATQLDASFFLSFLLHVFEYHLPEYSCVAGSAPVSSSSTPPRIAGLSAETDLFGMICALGQTGMVSSMSSIIMPLSSSSLSASSVASPTAVTAAAAISPTAVQRPAIPTPAALTSMLVQPTLPSYLLHSTGDAQHVGVIFLASLSSFLSIHSFTIYFYVDSTPLHMVMEIKCSAPLLANTVLDEMVFVLIREKVSGGHDVLQMEYHDISLIADPTQTLFFHTFFVATAAAEPAANPAAQVSASQTILPTNHYHCVLSYDPNDDDNLVQSLLSPHSPIMSLSDLWLHWSRLHLLCQNREDMNELIQIKIMTQEERIRERKQQISEIVRENEREDEQDDPHFLVFLPSLPSSRVFSSSAVSSSASVPSLASSVTLHLLPADMPLLIGQQQPNELMIMIFNSAPIPRLMLSILGIQLAAVSQVHAVFQQEEQAAAEHEQHTELLCPVENGLIILPPLSHPSTLLLCVPISPFSRSQDEKQRPQALSPLSRRSPPPIRTSSNLPLSPISATVGERRDLASAAAPTSVTLSIALILSTYTEQHSYNNSSNDSVTHTSPLTYHAPLTLHLRLTQLGHRFFLYLTVHCTLPDYVTLTLMDYTLTLPSKFSIANDGAAVCLGSCLRGQEKMGLVFELEENEETGNASHHQHHHRHSHPHSPSGSQGQQTEGHAKTSTQGSEARLSLSLSAYSSLSSYSASSASTVVTSFPVSLSTVHHHADLHLLMSLPSTVQLGCAFHLSITIMLKPHPSAQTQAVTLLLSLLPCSSFYYAGSSSTVFTLHSLTSRQSTPNTNQPHNTYTFTVACYPLIAGYCAIPTITLQQQQSIPHTLQNTDLSDSDTSGSDSDDDYSSSIRDKSSALEWELVEQSRIKRHFNVDQRIVVLPATHGTHEMRELTSQQAQAVMAI